MAAVVLLSGIAAFTLVYFIAKEFENIAVMKGHDGKRYFWWTFWCWFVGMLMVAALPDKKQQEQQQKMISLLSDVKENTLVQKAINEMEPGLSYVDELPEL